MNCFLAGNKNFMPVLYVIKSVFTWVICSGFNLFLLEASINSVDFLSSSTSSEMSMKCLSFSGSVLSPCLVLWVLHELLSAPVSEQTQTQVLLLK